MDIKAIVGDIIKDYIRKTAMKKNKLEDAIRVCLYLKSQKEVGIYILEDFKATDDEVRLKDVLGMWTTMQGIVNGFISKSLQRFAAELGCGLDVVNSMVWLEGGNIVFYLYNQHTAVRRITLDELLKE